jgi:hypothetical protein
MQGGRLATFACAPHEVLIKKTTVTVPNAIQSSSSLSVEVPSADLSMPYRFLYEGN